jgi:hypothetical protein
MTVAVEVYTHGGGISYTDQISEDKGDNAMILQQNGGFQIVFGSGNSWMWNFHGNGLAEADLLLVLIIPLILFRLISSSEST